MRLNLIHKLTISFIFLVGIALYAPIIDVENIEAILASATFLFGIFYGFEASVVLQNFASLKTLVSTETASLVALFHLSQIFPKDTSDEIGDRIVNYLHKAIDHPLTHYVKLTNKEFFAIFEPLRKVEPKSEAQSNAIAYMHESMYYLPQTRGQISQVAPRDVDPPEWIMLIILGLIIITALLLGRDLTLVSKLSAAIFSTTVIGALLLLDEIDSNRIQEQRLEVEIFNDALLAIGKEIHMPKNEVSE